MWMATCGAAWLGRSEGGRRALLQPLGDLLGKIHLPETCANLVFGGPLRNRLLVCGTSVYTLYVGTRGALKP
jgi:gluconolactonase